MTLCRNLHNCVQIPLILTSWHYFREYVLMVKKRPDAVCSFLLMYMEEESYVDCYFADRLYPSSSMASTADQIEVSLGLNKVFLTYENRALEYDRQYEIYLITVADVRLSQSLFMISEPISFSGKVIQLFTTTSRCSYYKHLHYDCSF